MPTPAPGGDLQFDEVKLPPAATSASACVSCKRPVTGVYFEINGRVVCSSCRDRVERSLRGGSPGRRVLTAIALGGATALAGSVGYYLVLKLTGYNFGLIAALVGFAVGRAVRRGSGNRGGRGYQVIAVLLTYLSIAGTAVPEIWEGVRAGAQKSAMTHAASISSDDQSDVRSPRPAAQTELGGVRALIAGVLVVAIALAWPIVFGVSHPLSLFITAIGLYEAWRVNKGLNLVINGPFQIAPPERAHG